MKPAAKHSGFTLVELAIVLVLIGLIVGAVLVGQDLVKAATIRSSVGEFEKYNAAATTFRGKYGGLPGDLSQPKAVEFNLSAAADANATGAVGLRDGNGLIEGGAAGASNLIGEIALFWKDLGATGLIAGTYPAAGTTLATGANVTAATVSGYLPRSRLRETIAHFVYSAQGRHYFYLAAITTDGAAAVTPANAVTAFEAKTIDEKMDDGLPTSGVVVSMTDLVTTNPGAAAASTVCNTNATPSLYNVSSAATGAAETQVCQLRLNTAF
ncbi:MAG: prepilin-type N-terminal cleavage/methylation domain-containing protein [Alphaproteobacteria bacterium]|nr:prepilin-type N-terminal cleavage/methylation domain-containing protein [Alphaproteobacteria bacterium]